MFAQAYAEFYAKGGTVKTLPGFDSIKPIPAYKPPRKNINRKSKAVRAKGQEND